MQALTFSAGMQLSMKELKLKQIDQITPKGTEDKEMTLLASAPEGIDFELAPEGNHLAVCYMVCDLGYHETEWLGVKSNTRKVRLSFELSGTAMEDGRPFSISRNYTLSLSNKANLRKDLQSWRGRAFTEEELKGFDLFNVLGKACLVNVIHTVDGQRTYANAASIASLPKGTPSPDICNDLVKFSLDDFNQSIYNALPEWLRNKINVHTQQKTEPVINDDFDDDIPF